MADFKTKEDVEAWVAEHGIGELEWALSTGKFAGQSRVIAQAWQWEQKAAEQAEDAERSRDLTERAVRAAESSAAAARDAATWSRWAAVIAVAALLISAWPHIRS